MLSDTGGDITFSYLSLCTYLLLRLFPQSRLQHVAFLSRTVLELGVSALLGDRVSH